MTTCASVGGRCRRADFEYARGFDTSLEACEDYELHLRITRDFPIEFHDEVVAEERQHDTNTVNDQEPTSKSAMIVIRSQWRSMRAKREYVEVYEKRMRAVQDRYSCSLLANTQTEIRERKWRQASSSMLTLLRNFPGCAFSALRGGLS